MRSVTEDRCSSVNMQMTSPPLVAASLTHEVVRGGVSGGVSTHLYIPLMGIRSPYRNSYISRVPSASVEYALYRSAVLIHDISWVGVSTTWGLGVAARGVAVAEIIDESALPPHPTKITAKMTVVSVAANCFIRNSPYQKHGVILDQGHGSLNQEHRQASS